MVDQFRWIQLRDERLESLAAPAGPSLWLFLPLQEFVYRLSNVGLYGCSCVVREFLERSDLPREEIRRVAPDGTFLGCHKLILPATMHGWPVALPRPFT
jgi:hypothetical protein